MSLSKVAKTEHFPHQSLNCSTIISRVIKIFCSYSTYFKCICCWLPFLYRTSFLQIFTGFTVLPIVTQVEIKTYVCRFYLWPQALCTEVSFAQSAHWDSWAVKCIHNFYLQLIFIYQFVPLFFSVLSKEVSAVQCKPWDSAWSPNYKHTKIFSGRNIYSIYSSSREAWTILKTFPFGSN